MSIEEKVKIVFPPLLSVVLAALSNIVAHAQSITAVLDLVLKSFGICAAGASLLVSYYSFKKLKREHNAHSNSGNRPTGGNGFTSADK